jgi:hypothetical protein
MSAADAIRAARAIGIDLGVDGDDLVLNATVPPPPALLALLSRHKVAILALLRPTEDGWSADDWRVFFGERAGIAEFDGGLSRQQAEARAFACCVAEWLNLHPVRSQPGHCLGCGGGEQTHDPLVPFGGQTSGHAWLHSRCWPAWHAGRKTEAIRALATMGIAAPAHFPDDFGKNGGM